MILLAVVNILYFISFATSPISGNDADEQMSTMRKLRKDLLANYDKVARPTVNISSPIPVWIQFVPISLVDLDEKTGTITMNAWIPLMWSDYKLKWNPDNYDKIYWTHFGSEELWRPNIVLVNCFPITDTEPWHKGIIFLSNFGNVYQVTPATIRTRCPEIFKEDKNIKTCNITIGGLMSKGNEIDLKIYWNKISTEEFRNNNSVWEITDMKYYFEDYRSNPRYSSMFIFSLNLKRRFDFTKHVTNGPHTVAILLTLVMFWLPPNSYKKINLGCLVLLLLSNLMLYLSSTVSSPSFLSSTVAPLRNTFLIAASALLIEIMILNMSRLSSVLKISPTVIRILSGMVGKIIGVCPPREFKDETEMTTLSENNEEQIMTKQCLSAEEEWFIVAMSLDRIFFVIYLVIILIA